ncbi:MAG: TIGR04283 family arsenosugar biosynthesis glycosyltransferase [Haliscomenobacter sp.]|uniref:TIGR04283 family arsenosugar biosynthesis glycosyltransferase n=1 Tax=Haliscomenobacter sp. TaxID=2717303 RepID=UPI0029B5F89C|nr:TIGR04283 family arsenosugar biosynthesis glycosyltransferase [Haliscomenobacter sp.]MDX2070461.1 TIGR04283 family arsenosugar biosynthesis glycosyltransferase [Haliscomenobacter sp.]
MNVSIIIPTLNEASNIARLLEYIRQNAGPELLEVILVDGGSTDDTAGIALANGAQVIDCPIRSRAAQMNLGARHAQGEVLYFIHADTLPPQNFLKAIRTALETGWCMGCFRYRFDSPSWLLKCNAWFTRFNFLWCQGGDKTFFIIATTFAELGGYDEKYVIMEEYDFIRRARKKYPMPTLPYNATVSARKYEHNSWLRVQFANWLVFNLFTAGLEPVRLKKIYRQILN